MRFVPAPLGPTKWGEGGSFDSLRTGSGRVRGDLALHVTRSYEAQDERRNNKDTLLPPNPNVFERTFARGMGRGVWGM